jgi:GT2 family glycosyltransferase
MDVSVIVVNYNSSAFLTVCLDSLLTGIQGVSFEVIVVDNCSDDGVFDQIKVRFPNIQYIENKVNRGFAAATNQGIAKASGDFILLLNPDAKVSSHALQETIAFFRRHPKAGIAGCKISYIDGRLQYSAHSFPSPLTLFSEAMFLDVLFPGSTIFGTASLTYFSYNEERRVDWVMGAYLMVRREVVMAVGLLDERFFMYSEEVDYCYRAMESGYEVWFIPQAMIVHYWGGMSAVSKRSLLWSHLSQLILFQKHFHGMKMFLMIFLRFLSIVNRILVYFIVGCIMFKKGLLKKSYYQSYALCRLILDSWSFQPVTSPDS